MLEPMYIACNEKQRRESVASRCHVLFSTSPGYIGLAIPGPA